LAVEETTVAVLAEATPLVGGSHMRLSALIMFIIVCCALSIAVAAPNPAIDRANGNHVSFTMSYRITAAPGTNRVQLVVVVPRTLAGRQKIVQISHSLEPSRKFEQDGNSYVEFVFANPVGTTEITIAVDAEILRFDLSVATTHKTIRTFESKTELEKWLAHEEYLEKDAPEIQKIAKTLMGTSEDETVRKTMAFVGGALRKGLPDAQTRGARWALQKKQGNHMDFADLFVTLCRANNLPARFRQGYVIPDAPGGNARKHAWAEVYLGKYGWVPFDPLHVHQRLARVAKLAPVYVYLNNQRRNAVLNNYHYYAFHYWGDPVQVQSQFKLKSLKSRKAMAPR
jgi:transglutaminase-like putative cysteine protease